MCANLLQNRGWQSCLLASGSHALYSATPLFDETEFVKHAPDHPVPEFRHALSDVVNRQAQWKQTRVFDLDAVIEYGLANGRSIQIPSALVAMPAIATRRVDRSIRSR
jgi:hypothetical protein